ncbi:MAG: hypothetical protein EOO73_22210 [Myxococcales bacterium]|nr:MAG: hypothetical protein EOO73_22210 [Myxococcales bacterium]
MGRVLLLVLVGLAACGGDDKQRRELVDDGQVCLRLQPSGSVEVDVVFRDCLTSCDVAQPATCAVSKEAGEEAGLRVASRGVVESTGASVCSPGCGALRASCTSTDTFAPGSITVHHGADSAQLLLGTNVQCLF